jgi:uncharacterized iron-regulated protein
MRNVKAIPLIVIIAVSAAVTCAAADRPLMWIDACEGEPVEEARVVKDLATARVVYLGERHTLQRHHATQAKIIDGLAKGGAALVVAMEQLDSSQQAEIDRFNRGELDFDGLARAISWEKHWPNYRQYRLVLEAARRAKAPVIGLGPSADAIRAAARSGGVAKLDPDVRKKLPAEMELRDPPYEKLLAAQMMVHIAATPEKLRPMIEAQIARDEAMSAALVDFLRSEQGRLRKAVVICGAGHVAYGLGTPQRVRRRLRDDNDRIVILAECGDLRLSPEERAAARPIEIPHELLRAIGRPLGDYVEVAWPAGANGRAAVGSQSGLDRRHQRHTLFDCQRPAAEGYFSLVKSTCPPNGQSPSVSASGSTAGRAAVSSQKISTGRPAAVSALISETSSSFKCSGFPLAALIWSRVSPRSNRLPDRPSCGRKLAKFALGVKLKITSVAGEPGAERGCAIRESST